MLERRTRRDRGPQGWLGARIWAGVALMIGVPILLFGLGAGGAHAAPAVAPFTVQVVATPSSGSVPLTVTLTATVSSGTPSSVAWTFGDGGSWSGSGTAALSVQHRYAVVGTFSAIAIVTEPVGQASGSVAIGVESGTLVATISTTAPGGPSPLAITFRALVSGGTGTYTDFVWTFGDGGVGAGPVVSYTYSHVGSYVAQLTVIDSANETTTASVPIAVASSAPVGPTFAGLGPTTIATAGVVGAGLTFGVYYGVRRRRHARTTLEEDLAEIEALPPGVFGPTGSAFSASVPAEAGASAAIDSSTSESAASVVEPAASPSIAPSFNSIAPATSVLRAVRTRSARAPGEEPRRWSRDLVAYLGALPTLGPDDIPNVDWTQKGMSDRLGTGQNQISNVLRRLCASGIVVERLEHVQGQPRRLKVYRLTLRGEALAREVRRRKPTSNPNLLRNDW